MLLTPPVLAEIINQSALVILDLEVLDTWLVLNVSKFRLINLPLIILLFIGEIFSRNVVLPLNQLACFFPCLFISQIIT